MVRQHVGAFCVTVVDFMSQPQYNFTLLLRVWSASPSPWQNYSLHRDVLVPSPSSLQSPELVPPAHPPCVQLIQQWGLQLGGTQPLSGCCFIPSASSCSYLAGTTGRSSPSRMMCRGEVQKLLNQALSPKWCQVLQLSVVMWNLFWRMSMWAIDLACCFWCWSEA